MRTVSVGGDAVEVNLVVHVVLEAGVAHLRNLYQTVVAAHGGVELPHVGGRVDHLRVLPVAVLIARFVVVEDHAVVGHAAVEQVVADEAVDGVVGVGEVVEVARAVGGLHIVLLLQALNDFLAVGQVAFLIDLRGDAEGAGIDVVGLDEGGVAHVAVLGIVVGELAQMYRQGTVVALVRHVEVFVERVAEGGTLQQVGEDFEVVGLSNLLVKGVERGEDDGIDDVDEAVRHLDVALDDARRAVDDEVGIVVHIAGEQAVREARHGEGAAGGEVGRLVGGVVAVVDDAALGHGVQFLCREFIEGGHAEGVEVVLHGLVGGQEDGIVAAGGEHAVDGRCAVRVSQFDALEEGLGQGEFGVLADVVGSGQFALDHEV